MCEDLSKWGRTELGGDNKETWQKVVVASDLLGKWGRVCNSGLRLHFVRLALWRMWTKKVLLLWRTARRSASCWCQSSTTAALRATAAWRLRRPTPPSSARAVWKSSRTTSGRRARYRHVWASPCLWTYEGICWPENWIFGLFTNDPKKNKHKKARHLNFKLSTRTVVAVEQSKCGRLRWVSLKFCSQMDGSVHVVSLGSLKMKND